jgi:hypothetical protein
MAWDIQQASTPVADVFKIVSRELTDLSVRLGEMHAPVEPETWRQLARDSAWVSALQNIDRIEQMLTALSQFLAGAADQCRADWRIDAAAPASAITLTQLRDRLHPASAVQYDAHAAGECELF